jgi:hypothetical protein
MRQGICQSFATSERVWSTNELSEIGLTSFDDTRVISLLSFNRYPAGSQQHQLRQRQLRQRQLSSEQRQLRQRQLSTTSTLAEIRVEEGPWTNYN